MMENTTIADKEVDEKDIDALENQETSEKAFVEDEED
jgi:hypothetical protein